MSHAPQKHEGHAAAGERVINSKGQTLSRADMAYIGRNGAPLDALRKCKIVPSGGSLAVASAYRDMLAVYRAHGTDCTNPTRCLEIYHAARGLWLSAEKRLQRLSLEAMIRTARANPRFYRVVAYDYAGRAIVLDAARTKLRGE